MVMLAGMERARGFRLDDYGVVFDVEFPSMRRSMVWSLQQLERASTGDAKIKAAASGPSIQPREIYLTEITNALVDAILDHGTPIGVGADEWLTVAARESVDRRFVPADPNDTPMTIILRIKGSDLAALRDRQLSTRRSPQAGGDQAGTDPKGLGPANPKSRSRCLIWPWLEHRRLRSLC